jgi:hypothetical protein
MKKLFTLLIFNSFICQSQVVYHDGYYIDINNQEFNIKIKDYTFEEDVKYLFYKEEGTENELSIPIENIQSFVFKKNRDFMVFREVIFNDYFEVNENNIQTKKVILSLLSNGKNSSLYHRIINQKDEFFFTDLNKQAFILNENNFKDVIKKAFYFETDEIFENVEFNKNKLMFLFNKINLMEEIKINENEEKNLNITTLEEIPIYPGCEQLATREVKMQCFNKKFMNHFSNNFNMPEIVKNQPNEVNIRVLASFVIDKDGYIKLTHVRAPFTEIEIELHKVFEKFPKITPGKKDGNPVSVRYAIPINLKTETPVNSDYYKRNNRYDPNRLHPYSTKN